MSETGVFHHSSTLHVQQRIVKPDIDMLSGQEKATSRWKSQESDHFGESLKDMRCVNWLKEVFFG
jgi:hypothetical protein